MAASRIPPMAVGGPVPAGRRAPPGAERGVRHDPSRAHLLRPYHAVADGLAALFSPFVEAVVHDRQSDTAVHVAHPFSPRAVGDPSDLREADFAPDASVIGPYEKTQLGWPPYQVGDRGVA